MLMPLQSVSFIKAILERLKIIESGKNKGIIILSKRIEKLTRKNSLLK